MSHLSPDHGRPSCLLWIFTCWFLYNICFISSTILQQLFPVIFPKALGRLTYSRQENHTISCSVPHNPSCASGSWSSQCWLQLDAHFRFIGTERGSVVFCLCQCFCREPSASLRWDYLVYLVLAQTGRRNNACIDQADALSCAVALEFETRSHWERSSTAIAYHLVHSGTDRWTSSSERHPECRQLLTYLWDMQQKGKERHLVQMLTVGKAVLFWAFFNKVGIGPSDFTWEKSHET